MEPIGRMRWVVPGGRIPLKSTGREPAFTSRDSLCVLNAGDEMANVRIWLFYADAEPVGPYPLNLAPRRVRHVRFNDLIDPVSMPLELDYAAVIEADVPVVVQFSRMNTGQRELAIMGTIAFPGDR